MLTDLYYRLGPVSNVPYIVVVVRNKRFQIPNIIRSMSLRNTFELRFDSHLFTKKRGLTFEIICRMKTVQQITNNLPPVMISGGR